MAKKLSILATITLPPLVAALIVSIPAVFATTVGGWPGITLGLMTSWVSGILLAYLAWRDLIPVRRLLQNVKPVGKDVHISGDLWAPADKEFVDEIGQLAAMFPEVVEQMRASSEPPKEELRSKN